MASGHYVAVLIDGAEMRGMMNWMEEYLPGWGPLPCTEYTKDSYLEMLNMLAEQDAPGLMQFIPFHVPTERDVMFTKLTWNVIKNYPWSEHPM